jgi:hypothetical protein
MEISIRHLGACGYPFVARAHCRLSFGVMNGGLCKVFNAARRTLMQVLKRRHRFSDDTVARSS